MIQWTRTDGETQARFLEPPTCVQASQAFGYIPLAEVTGSADPTLFDIGRQDGYPQHRFWRVANGLTGSTKLLGSETLSRLSDTECDSAVARR